MSNHHRYNSLFEIYLKMFKIPVHANKRCLEFVEVICMISLQGISEAKLYHSIDLCYPSEHKRSSYHQHGFHARYLTVLFSFAETMSCLMLKFFVKKVVFHLFYRSYLSAIVLFILEF